MYEEIDKILLPWLKKYGLHVYTKYRDDEVRAIDVVDDAGEVYGMSVSPLDESGKCIVYAGSRRLKSGKSLESSLSDLENNLDNAYAQIEEWIRNAGHTRTPVL
jgi:predicted RNA-binding protein